MKRQKREEVNITVYLRVEHAHGESTPDIRAFFQALLHHPTITNSIVWGTPSWKDILPPWTDLADSPFEPGDVLIHVCQIEGITRTLLARYDGERIDYLPYAEEEAVEWAVYEHLKATYPYSHHGFYPCPPRIRAVYERFIEHRAEPQPEEVFSLSDDGGQLL